MQLITGARRRLFLLNRRRWSSIFIIVTSLLLLLVFSFSGYAEECLSRTLLVFYPNPSPDSSLQLSGVPVPPLLLSPASACSSAPFLLILVPSAPSHRDRRDTIRQTWGSPSSSAASSSLTLFVLGVPGTVEGRSALLHEAVTHGDIIQANFTDSYRNLTLKTLTALTWALRKCQGAKFLLKADDDVFVNTPALSAFLQDQRGLGYFGRVHWRVAPFRDLEHRHYVSPDIYAGDYFPPYCSGTAYVLSFGVIGHIVQKVGSGPWPTVEDVFIGILAKAAGITPQHVSKMAGSMVAPHNRCCYQTMFTSHGMEPRSMREAWNMVNAAEDHWCPPLTLLFCRTFGKTVEDGKNSVS
ncbi:beta-1,3-galactosyltransferase 4 [Gastrophryne carolinensis]